MKKVLVGILAVFGAIFLLLVIMFVIFAMSMGERGTVPSKAVLEIDFERELVEDVPNDPVAKALMEDTTSIRDIVDALDKGADDKRVAGVVARFGGNSMGLAHAQEIRDAVLRFRKKGKFAYAFAETFGEWSGGTQSYYLASAFDRIYLQPSGDVNLTGIMLQGQFVKNTLDKLDLKYRGDQRYEYKNAMNTFTETKFTAPHKEAMTKVMDSMFSQVLRGVSEARKIPEDQLRAAIDKAPLLGQDAVDAKLVDELKYRDQVFDEAKQKAGNGAELIFSGKYLARAGRPHTSGKKVALIYGAGGVQRGKSGYSGLFGGPSMGSETVAAAFRTASEDKNVKAIIFRVDSPGGSYVASDTIWREVKRAREKGKPVIVTMGNVAGSGGYFVAMSADKIVAQPGTITGSIGVLGGKVVTTGLFGKLGITFDEVHSGRNATMYSDTKDYSPEEWQELQASLDRIYTDFTSKVAEGRNLGKEKVLQIAKGRIWSGEDAKQLGLVDELGGMETAMRLAKQAAKIDEKDDVNLVQFPARKNLYDTVFGDKPENSEKTAAIEMMTRAIRSIEPVARRMQVLGGTQGRELMIPEYAY